MEVDKSGKVKMTFEVEINESAMDLIKSNMEIMSDVLGQAAQNWRDEMARRRKEGKMGGMGSHSIGGMMGHMQGKE